MTPIQFNRGAINAGQCVSQGWELIKNEYWLFLGISFVGMLIAGCIPCVSLFLAGPIMAGIFYCLLTRMNGGYVAFGDLFKGFDKFVPNMALGIIQAIPEIIAQIFRVGIDLSAQSLNRGGSRSGDFFLQTSQRDLEALMAGGLLGVIVVVGLVLFIIGIALRITFFFVYPLVMEYNLSIGEAIKTSASAGWSNVGGLIVLMILEGLLAIAGVLALCVGIFFVMPVIQSANAIAYRQVFPPRSTGFTPNTPPPPTDFGAAYGRPANF